jgi:hypothetical protein
LLWSVPIKKPGAKAGDRSVINEDIRVSPIRLVGAAGEQVGIVSRDEGLAEARKAGMDLVLIAPDADPPVCKVMDYGKHLFELKKQKSAQRKKTEADPSQRDEVSSWHRRRRLSGQTTQPDSLLRRWRQGQGVTALPRA